MTLIISSSLNPKSKSLQLARLCQGLYSEICSDVTLLDMKEYDLPLCNAGSCYQNSSVKILGEKILNAKGILVSTPIYNYDVNAALKTLLECTGKAWSNKVIGFMTVAGGTGSYMSLMGFINSLMLDFRCLVVPRFVYATEADFDQERLTNDAIKERLALLVNMHFSVSSALTTVLNR
ncbi:MAG: NAD(P)H-dependent oxidoreductase [bacterium]